MFCHCWLQIVVVYHKEPPLCYSVVVTVLKLDKTIQLYHVIRFSKNSNTELVKTEILFER